MLSQPTGRTSRESRNLTSTTGVSIRRKKPVYFSPIGHGRLEVLMIDSLHHVEVNDSLVNVALLACYLQVPCVAKDALLRRRMQHGQDAI
jgi:hypothetical protein